MKNLLLPLFLTFLFSIQLFAQRPQSVEGNVNNLPVREYTIVINQELVNIGGKEKMGMTING
ncbi:hypothetical protein, partial [Salinimicrobium oceani]